MSFEEHAAFVRDLFRRYLEIGSVVRLKEVLDEDNVRLPLRTDGTGKTTGGGLISRGHLYKMLSNPIYLGRLTHRGQVYEGVHYPIIDRETWDRVEAAADVKNAPPLLGGFLLQRPIDAALCSSPAPGNLAHQGRKRRCPPAVGREEPKKHHLEPKKHHLWKRKFSAGDFRPCSTANGRQTHKMAAVDRNRSL
jgi:Recombinase